MPRGEARTDEEHRNERRPDSLKDRLLGYAVFVFALFRFAYFANKKLYTTACN